MSVATETRPDLDTLREQEASMVQELEGVKAWACGAAREATGGARGGVPHHRQTAVGAHEFAAPEAH